MAFVLDILATVLLFAASIIAWWRAGRARISSRTLIRFAAVLFAALATAWVLRLAGFADLAPAVAMIALSLGGTALCLGLFAVLAHPLPPLVSALGLMLALFAGVAAALAGQPLYALSIAVLGSLLTSATALGGFFQGKRRGLLALGAVLAIPLGGFALLDGAFDASLILFAAGLIGAARASEPGIESKG